MNIQRTASNVPTVDTFFSRVADDSIKQLTSRKDQKIIAYTRGTQKATEAQVDLWTNISRRLGLSEIPECYKVDTFSGISVRTNHVYKITSAQYGSMDITIYITAGALDGGEIRLTEQLARRNEPQKALKDFLEQWTEECIDQFGEKIFTDLSNFQATLQNAITNKGRGIGLRATASAQTSARPVSAETRIFAEVNDIRLQPKGYSDFVKIGFDTTLVPLQAGATFANDLNAKKEELKKLLSAWLQDFISTEITFNQLTEGMHSRVRDNIINYWNRRLADAQKGWKVAELRLRFEEVLPESFRSKEMDIEIVLKNAKINLVNTVILNLVDPQKYKNARVENIENWLTEKLRQTIQNVLSGISYAELVARIDEYRAIIKNDLDKEVRRIGYQVDYLLTSEQISSYKDTVNFEFDDSEQVFDTDSNDQVKLNVIINGQIISPDHDILKRYLLPGMDLEKEMKKEVLREVRKYILRCKPDQYYLDFDSKIAPAITHALRELLNEKFNVRRDVDIVLRWQGSELIQRLDELKQDVHETFVVYGAAGSGQMKFKIKFNVESVAIEHWGRFSARGKTNVAREIELLKELLKDEVENFMRRELDDIPQLTDTRLADFVKQFAKAASKMIARDTGLVLYINTVSQVNNEYFDSLLATKGRLALENIGRVEDRIRALSEKIEEEKADPLGANEKDIKKLEKEKSELEKQIMGDRYNANKLRPSDPNKGLMDKWLKDPDGFLDGGN